MNRRRHWKGFLWTIAAGAAAAATILIACGPNFPHMLLNGGEGGILAAPVARFHLEIERLRLAISKHPAKPAPDRPLDQTIEADIADLAATLKASGSSDAEADGALARYRVERGRLRQWAEAGEEFLIPEEDRRLAAPEGIPGEFADYFRGAIAWHRGDAMAARAAWEALLRRPETERRYKSTWAAFMLGRAAMKAAEEEEAIGFFRQVRELAGRGFPDSLGLAASSLGWEARVHLEAKRYGESMRLYLEQAAGDDPSAMLSLRIAAAEALRREPSVLRELASDPIVQQVLTTYVLSDQGGGMGGETGEGSMAERWLEAVEGSDAREVVSAEKLAVAAYQAGQFELADRWVKRSAAGSVTGQWIQAKLWLRLGRVHEAAEVLARVAAMFPVLGADQGAANAARVPAGFEDCLYVDMGDGFGGVSARERLLGELGALRLVRREYVESLDALFRAGFWFDAAYVAERVLTLEELKTYVDRFWPGAAESSRGVAETKEGGGSEEESVENLDAGSFGERLRYLLGRRLARENREKEARAYFPAEWLGVWDELTAARLEADDEEKEPLARARALFRAARITRESGMELFGTEVEPDWRIHGGGFETGVTVADRGDAEAAGFLTASAEETERAIRHHPVPQTRFHYRYKAAALAWEAAKRMPDESDETARVLWTGGSWLKNRDPEGADSFYKALVIRCGKTAIGAAADKLRWFPKLDENGNLLPERKPGRVEEPLEEPDPLLFPIR